MCIYIVTLQHHTYYIGIYERKEKYGLNLEGHTNVGKTCKRIKCVQMTGTKICEC